MAAELRLILTALLDEVYAVSSARVNCSERAGYTCPRDMMLAAHGEWQALVAELKLGQDDTLPAVLASRTIRLAAVLIKGAAELGELPPPARVEPPTPGTLVDHGYVVAVKSSKRSRRPAGLAALLVGAGGAGREEEASDDADEDGGPEAA